MANLICAKCNEIVDEQNAVECPFCWEIYHKECWEDTENCVTCKKYNPIYEIAQAQKELEAQNQEKEEQENKNINNVIEDEDFTETVTREMPSSPVANMVLFISNIVLALGIVAGVACIGYIVVIVWMTYAEIGTLNAIISLVKGVFSGAVVIAMGWILSVLIKGFAELVNNSQKNAYYLSKLVKMVEDEE